MGWIKCKQAQACAYPVNQFGRNEIPNLTDRQRAGNCPGIHLLPNYQYTNLPVNHNHLTFIMTIIIIWSSILDMLDDSGW